LTAEIERDISLTENWGGGEEEGRKRMKMGGGGRGGVGGIFLV